MSVEFAWHWRIRQEFGCNWLTVAGGTCYDRKRMLSEMNHYAALYAEEGPIELQTRTGKNRWKRHTP